MSDELDYKQRWFLKWVGIAKDAGLELKRMRPAREVDGVLHHFMLSDGEGFRTTTYSYYQIDLICKEYKQNNS